MSSKLLDVLFSNPCTHQFSWPRRSPKGNYYQVCLICGDEYQYDWSTMSRKASKDKMGKASAQVPD